ncbi:MAG: hypothetical protein K9M80_07115 [Candidatus Marinimicrobia bacterium]|nr:hypothetical protein [Candidatus Neomarinimicrobiota bacterium]
MIISNITAQPGFLTGLSYDTLTVELPFDSLISNSAKTPQIIDRRELKPRQLGITQINKYMFIPVDQYITLNNSIAQNLAYQFQQDSIYFADTLVIDNLTLWYDSKPCLSAAHVLNGYSYITKNGHPVKQYRWEIRRKKQWGETKSENFARLFQQWLKAQADSIATFKTHQNVSPMEPLKYRRVFKSWSDFVVLQDGFIVNMNLTLDFPKDHGQSAIFGSGGLYYRQTSYLQSIGFYAFDQHWLYRINRAMVGRLNSNLRFGMNKLNRNKFDQPDWEDLLMLNMGLSAAVQYQPLNYRGLFFGGGLYLNINGLPTLPGKMKIIEPGLLFILGVRLP